MTTLAAGHQRLRRTSGHILAALLAAGMAAILSWEAVARLVAPISLGKPLVLAAILQVAMGLSNPMTAQLLHVAIGLIVFPLGYVFLVRPIAIAVLPGAKWWVVGIVYALGLWALGLGILAYVSADFLGSNEVGAVAWLSLIGHLAYGLALSGMLRWQRM
jgi:hypothetical protein